MTLFKRFVNWLNESWYDSQEPVKESDNKNEVKKEDNDVWIPSDDESVDEYEKSLPWNISAARSWFGRGKLKIKNLVNEDKIARTMFVLSDRANDKITMFIDCWGDSFSKELFGILYYGLKISKKYYDVRIIAKRSVQDVNSEYYKEEQILKDFGVLRYYSDDNISDTAKDFPRFAVFDNGNDYIVEVSNGNEKWVEGNFVSMHTLNSPSGLKHVATANETFKTMWNELEPKKEIEHD